MGPRVAHGAVCGPACSQSHYFMMSIYHIIARRKPSLAKNVGYPLVYYVCRQLHQFNSCSNCPSFPLLFVDLILCNRVYSKFNLECFSISCHCFTFSPTTLLACTQHHTSIQAAWHHAQTCQQTCHHPHLSLFFITYLSLFFIIHLYMQHKCYFSLHHILVFLMVQGLHVSPLVASMTAAI